METITVKALGTQWWIEVFSDDDKRRDSLKEAITALLSSIENRFSRFNDDSLIGQINQHKKIISTDQDLIFLLNKGKEYYLKTNGVFNILIAEELIARGYDKNYTLKTSSSKSVIGNPITDIKIEGEQISLMSGQIDLGGIGKGWAIDAVAKLIREFGYEEFLINGGGDMYGTSENNKPIRIYLEHPLHQNTYIGQTTVFNQGFAASSSHKRRWKTDDGETSHIVGDKKSVDASFIIANDTTTADIFATTALLLDESEFISLAKAENIAYGLCTLTTNSLTTSSTFPLTSL